MNKIHKHIAIGLLGIFIFPNIFQSLHIVWHHSHDCCGSICKHEHKTHHDAYDLSQHKTKFLGLAKSHCPICEYQFATNNLSIVQFFGVVVSISNTKYNETIAIQLHKQITRQTSPRAPPSLSES